MSLLVHLEMIEANTRKMITDILALKAISSVRGWNRFCSKIRLARDKGTHSICDLCMNYTAMMKDGNLTRADRDAVKAHRREHIAKQKRQREVK